MESATPTWRQADTRYLPGENLMVDFVRIAKDGTLLEIREVPDKYREKPYDENAE